MSRRSLLATAAAISLLAAGFTISAAPSARASTWVTTTTVTVRSGPGDSNTALSTLAAGTAVDFYCFVAGEKVTGSYGTEDIWDALDGGGYVPDALVYTGSNTPVVSACPSAQFGTGTYPVAWTGGSGVQARTGTSTGDGGVGGILPDGQLATVTCETSGETLTDSAGYTSSLWDELQGGGYVPNAYLDTEVNGPTPGLPACSSGGGGGGTGPAEPTGDIPFPYFPCQSPGGDASCPKLPKQPPPSAATALLYAADRDEAEDLLTACLADQLMNCYRMGQHYLSAAGTPETLSMADMYTGVPDLQAQFQYWLRQNVAEAVQNLSATPSADSARYNWDTAGTTQNWYVFHAVQPDNDWTWTLHGFSIRMVGDVWVGPEDSSGNRPVQVRYRSFMWDVYNFNFQPFTNLEDLAKHGMAADFVETGESPTEVVTSTLSAINPGGLIARGDGIHADPARGTRIPASSTSPTASTAALRVLRAYRTGCAANGTSAGLAFDVEINGHRSQPLSGGVATNADDSLLFDGNFRPTANEWKHRISMTRLARPTVRLGAGKVKVLFDVIVMTTKKTILATPLTVVIPAASKSACLNT